MANDRVVKAAEDAVFIYLSEGGSSEWGELAERWFRTNFENDAVSGGPCEGAPWPEFRKEVTAAMKRATATGVTPVAQWRTAPRDVNVSAGNPRPSTWARVPGAKDVDVTVNIDDTAHMGRVTLAPRASDGRLAALGDTAERWLSAELLEDLRAIIGKAQLARVLEQLVDAAIAVA